MMLLLKAGCLFALAMAPLSTREEALLQMTSESGRVVLPDMPDSRVAPRQQIAPGQPPLLSFRYYEGRSHHRFGNGELMLDDAGH